MIQITVFCWVGMGIRLDLRRLCLLCSTIVALRPALRCSCTTCTASHGLYRVVARQRFPLFFANICGSSLGWLENTSMSTQPICYLYRKESKQHKYHTQHELSLKCTPVHLCSTLYYIHHAASIAQLKFIYSEKAADVCEISTVDLSQVVTVKSMVEVSQIFWPSQNI